MGEPCGKALSGHTRKVDANGIRGQSGVAMRFGDPARQHRADRAVHVADRARQMHGLAAFDRWLAGFDQFDIECRGEAVVLQFGVIQRLALGGGHRMQDALEIDPMRLPVAFDAPHVDAIDTANHFLDRAEAHFGHDGAQLFGDEEEVVDHMFRRSGEALAQFGILRRHAHRAGVEMALAHHDAACGDQRRGGETEFVRTEQRADCDVATGPQPAVDLHRDAAAQIVEQQCLLSLGQADLPGRARMREAGQRRCAGPAFIARDGDMVGLGLGYARSDGTDPDLGDQLDRDAALGLDVLEVVDQLREILDRIDVVVRRGRDQPHAGGRMAHLADPLVDLVAGQLPSLTGLCALRHLDLNIVRIDEVFGGHAEAAAGDLLDPAAHGIAIVERQEAFGLLAAFAGVRTAAQPVHRDGECRMRFVADRTEAHRAGAEALDDFCGGFDFLEPERLLGRLEFHQSADGQQAFVLLVDRTRELVVIAGVVAAHSMLQLRDRLRRPCVRLAAQAELVDPADIEHPCIERIVTVGLRMTQHGFFGHFGEADALDRGGRAGEIGVDEVGIEPDRVEDLGAAIGLVGRDAHLGHDLENALADRLDVVLADIGRIEIGEAPGTQILERLEGDIGIDPFRTIAGERAEMVHFARFAGFDDQPGLHAQALPHQLVMHCGGGQQGGHGNAVGALAAIGQDQDVGIAQHRFGCRPAHFLERHGKAVGTGAGVPGDVDRRGAECAIERDLHRTDLGKPFIGKDRLADLEPLVRARVAPQQVGARTDHRQQAHHQFLADRVDRRIGDLREVLLEIIVQQAAAVGQHGDRRIGTHRTDRILAPAGHRLEEAGNVFLRIAKGLLALEQAGRRLGRLAQLGLDMIEVLELVLRRLEPLLIGFGIGEIGLELFILDDTALLEIDKQHATGLEAPFARDLAVVERQHAAFRGEHDEIVLGGAPAGRTQAIAVEAGADLAPVGEAHRRRAVPRLHQRRVIFVEGTARGIHQRVLRPCLGHEHHHRVREAVSTRQQQFERIVEAGRVRLSMRNQRPHLVEVGTEQLAFHRPTARFHPVHIAADRIDLAIVRHEAIGMRQPPAGEGIGREALVDEAERADAIGVAQIVVKAAHLVRQQEALVNHGAAGETGNIGSRKPRDAVLFLERGERVQRLFANHHELALERVAIGAALAARNHALADHGHRIDHRLAEAVERGRDIAPADYALAFLLGEAFELTLDEFARFRLLRQETHRDRVVARLRQVVAMALGPFAQQRIGHLQQDTGAVSQQRIGADRAAMVEIGQNFECLGDDRVAFCALDMRDHADPAGVVFVTRIVKTRGVGRRASHGRSVLLGARRPASLWGCGPTGSKSSGVLCGTSKIARRAVMPTGSKFCNCVARSKISAASRILLFAAMP